MCSPRNIAQIDRQIDALGAVRLALAELLRRVRLEEARRGWLSALTDAELSELTRPLPQETPEMKEDYRMDTLNAADRELSRLDDVRILTLPPMTVAASRFVGPEPEGRAIAPLIDWAARVKLLELKPDARLLGFNHPNPSPDAEHYGYEFWLSIPDDLDVPPPLAKRRFAGGLYAAHMIRMGDFHEWNLMMDWANRDERYAPNTLPDGGERMYGLLEEILNLPRHLERGGTPDEHTQLDLLLPIKIR